MVSLKTPNNVKLWFAVVDMEGNPDMAQVERVEDCDEEDAYVSIYDFEAQTARIKELEASRNGYANDAHKAVDLATEYRARAEAAEARAKKVVEQTRELEEWRGRWEIGFRNIVTRTIGPAAPFEIDQVVNLIEAAWKQREALEAACRRQVANIEHWLQTNESAGREESESIYKQLKAALRAGKE